MINFICFFIPISLWFCSIGYYNLIKEKEVRTPGLFFLFTSLIIVIPLIYLIFNAKVQNYIDVNKITSVEYVTNHFYNFHSYSLGSLIEAMLYSMALAVDSFFYIIIPIINMIIAFIYTVVCCAKLSDMKLKRVKNSKLIKLLKYESIPIVIFAMIFLCLYNYKDTIKQIDNYVLLEKENYEEIYK